MPLSRSLSLILRSLSPYRTQLLFSLMLIALHTILGFGLIFLTSRFRLDHVPVFLILLFSVHHLFSVFDDWILTGISQRWIQATRKKCLHDLLVHSEKSQANSQIDWNEVHMEVHWLGESIFSMLRSSLRKILQIVAFSAALFWISPILFLFCGILFVLVFLLGYFFGRVINRIQEQSILEHSSCSNFELEAARAMPLIRAFHKGSLFSSIHDRLLDRYTASSIRLSRLRMIFHPAQIILFLITLIVVYSAGSVMVHQGSLQQGSFFSFLAGLSLLHAPLSGLSQDISLFLSVRELKHINTILLDLSALETRSANETVSSVTLQDLSFSYNDQRPLLDGINARFSAGTVTGIQGANGSGKTTLALIIAGVLKPVAGQILFDDLPEPKGPVSLVDQNGTVFTLPLQENLFIEPPTRLSDDLLHTPFLSFLHGADPSRLISPETLSSGQRKCISLARAFQEAHPVILIDEPENALDLEMQALLHAKILEFKESRHIIVLFSHSESFLSICDQVIQLSSYEKQAQALPCST
ncbi:MAG: hypothetical protein CVU59_00735 [Deltaproteobacteria bacterium HGW-Deltaproteobacteria-17]|nr:MAG: hypothetical protein CVU59_00735 [Deltaproteobacteria bacterium HGW-Deltaproteobacteria-17]